MQPRHVYEAQRFQILGDKFRGFVEDLKGPDAYRHVGFVWSFSGTRQRSMSSRSPLQSAQTAARSRCLPAGLFATAASLHSEPSTLRSSPKKLAFQSSFSMPIA